MGIKRYLRHVAGTLKQWKHQLSNWWARAMAFEQQPPRHAQPRLEQEDVMHMGTLTFDGEGDALLWMGPWRGLYLQQMADKKKQAKLFERESPALTKYVADSVELSCFDQQLASKESQEKNLDAWTCPISKGVMHIPVRVVQSISVSTDKEQGSEKVFTYVFDYQSLKDWYRVSQVNPVNHKSFDWDAVEPATDLQDEIYQWLGLKSSSQAELVKPKPGKH